MDEFIGTLTESLKILSSNATNQVAYLNKLGLSGNVDELALEYDDVAGLAEAKLRSGDITEEQLRLIKEVASKLDQMSGTRNERFWTEAALMYRPECVQRQL